MMLLLTLKNMKKTKNHLPNSTSFSVCWTLNFSLPQDTVGGTACLTQKLHSSSGVTYGCNIN